MLRGFLPARSAPAARRFSLQVSCSRSSPTARETVSGALVRVRASRRMLHQRAALSWVLRVSMANWAARPMVCSVGSGSVRECSSQVDVMNCSASFQLMASTRWATAVRYRYRRERFGFLTAAIPSPRVSWMTICRPCLYFYFACSLIVGTSPFSFRSVGFSFSSAGTVLFLDGFCVWLACDPGTTRRITILFGHCGGGRGSGRGG